MSDVMERVVECMCCPECHCKEYVNKNLLGNGFRQCKQCGQEWWTDINYGKIDVHTKPLKAKIEQLESQLTATQGEVGGLNKQIDMLVDQINSMTNQLDKAEDEIERLEACVTNRCDEVERCHNELSRYQSGVRVEGKVFRSANAFSLSLDTGQIYGLPHELIGQRVTVIVLPKEGE